MLLTIPLLTHPNKLNFTEDLFAGSPVFQGLTSKCPSIILVPAEWWGRGKKGSHCCSQDVSLDPPEGSLSQPSGEYQISQAEAGPPP